jgi:lincosamide nucleotidyltransferase A/C/D/E
VHRPLGPRSATTPYCSHSPSHTNGQPALTTRALRPRSMMMMMMMQTDAAGQDMDIGEVLAVLADLTEAGCSVWVVGGWGVDALVGRQTRLHRDLDLALDARNETVALRVLERRGYRIETDWRPVRVELVAEGRGWVDVHPVVFDAAGHGRQADVGGGKFDYPSEAFDQGTLGGVRVPCLSRDQQLTFHSGYAPRAIDLLDLAQLERLT